MNNLKFAKKLALITIVLICIFILFLFWYKQTSSTQTIQDSKFNSSSLERRLLIVTQGSPFKDSITTRISTHYKSVLAVVEIIDVSALANKNVTDFDAILIIHRWEARAPSQTVKSFMDKNSRLKNKIVMLTTSWNGLEKMENVDAITGASVLDDVRVFTNKIIKKLDSLLNIKS